MWLYDGIVHIPVACESTRANTKVNRSRSSRHSIQVRKCLGKRTRKTMASRSTNSVTSIYSIFLSFLSIFLSPRKEKSTRKDFVYAGRSTISLTLASQRLESLESLFNCRIVFYCSLADVSNIDIQLSHPARVPPSSFREWKLETGYIRHIVITWCPLHADQSRIKSICAKCSVTCFRDIACIIIDEEIVKKCTRNLHILAANMISNLYFITLL